MTKVKRMLAIFMTLAMVLSMTIAMSATAFAEDEPPAYDYPLTVTGLAEGDTVAFYQVVEWVGNATGNVAGWKAVAPFDTVLTETVLKEMLVGSTNPSVAPTGMTPELAGKLAAKATGSGTPPTKLEGDTATFNNASSGMWMALVTPGDANTIYNPVFVSADYNKETGHTGTVAVTGTYANGVAKKSNIPLTKTASDSFNAYGDTITFTVNTKIPGYGEVYEHPHFVISDTMNNLTLKQDTVKITAPANLAAANYTINATATGYTITFAESYLKTVKTATDVTVTYSAIVTDAAGYAVNEQDNDVSIEYSHNPNSQSDYDVKKDTTQHYTFTLDASGIGEGQSVSGKKTSELVKIGVDAAGNPVTTRTETSAITSTETWTSPLAGAVFGLFTDSACTTPYKAKKADGTEGDTAMTATTGADGRMTFTGLDTGTYYLKEISAPAGYVADTKTYTVVIAATTKSVKVTEWWNGTAWVSTKPTSGTAKEVTYDTDIIESYTVTIDGVKAAEYKFKNPSTANSNEINWEIAETVEKPFPFSNTQGTELPSTGGIGTIIFYTLGTILVIGCGIVLVSRRRMQKNK